MSSPEAWASSFALRVGKPSASAAKPPSRSSYVSGGSKQQQQQQLAARPWAGSFDAHLVAVSHWLGPPSPCTPASLCSQELVEAEVPHLHIGHTAAAGARCQPAWSPAGCCLPAPQALRRAQLAHRQQQSRAMKSRKAATAWTCSVRPGHHGSLHDMHSLHAP